LHTKAADIMIFKHYYENIMMQYTIDTWMVHLNLVVCINFSDVELVKSVSSI